MCNGWNGETAEAIEKNGGTAVLEPAASAVTALREMVADGIKIVWQKRCSRNIEKDVKLRLQRRAARHGRSMEEEVRDILRNAVNEQDAAGGLGTEIASLFAKVGLEEDIPELRGYETKPVSFDR
jgi:antitoxin FitA